MLKRIIVLGLLAAVNTATPAVAETSGWMNAHDFERFSRKVLVRGNNMPTSIKCKTASSTKGLTRYNTLLIVTYKKTLPNKKWAWGWGATVTKDHINYTKKGYKRVSFSQVRRKSGLRLPCAIWHK